MYHFKHRSLQRFVPFCKISESSYDAPHMTDALDLILDFWEMAKSYDENRFVTWENIKRGFQGKLTHSLNSSDRDSLLEIFQNAWKIPATHGFGQGKVVYDALSGHEAKNQLLQKTLMELVNFGVYKGVVKVPNPEQAHDQDPLAAWESLDGLVDAVVDEDLYPFTSSGFIGLSTCRGLYSVRNLSAAYFSKEINFHAKGSPVVEIGSGMGLLARELFKGNASSITCYDLPEVAVFAIWNLVNSFGPEIVGIGRNADIEKPINIRHYKSFGQFNHTGASLANADSFPEMGNSIIKDYCRTARDAGITKIISYNHEACNMTSDGKERLGRVFQSAQDSGWDLEIRMPAWVRPGYVLECFS